MGLWYKVTFPVLDGARIYPASFSLSFCAEVGRKGKWGGSRWQVKGHCMGGEAGLTLGQTNALRYGQ